VLNLYLFHFHTFTFVTLHSERMSVRDIMVKQRAKLVSVTEYKCIFCNYCYI
jgi:hypothetical protein